MKSKFLLAISGVDSDLKKVKLALVDQLSSSDAFSDICKHLAKDFGKCVRSTMMVLWYRAIAGDQNRDDLIQLAVGIELIHMASLVHDDVLDQADMRRNMASVRALVGDQVAMLAGVYIYALALDSISKIKDPIYVSMISRMVKSLCSGEYLQLANRHQFFTKLDDYLNMVKQKTSVLFSTAIKATVHLADMDQSYLAVADQFGNAFGVIYQITDDVLDVYGEQADLGKGIGQDLEVGDANLPIQLLFIYMTDAEKAPLKNGFAKADLELIHSGLEKYKSRIIQAADQMIQEQYQLAKDALRQLPDTQYRSGISKILELVMERYRHQVLVHSS